MTPLEHIRKGIQTSDWTHVCDGFAALTGEKLTPPAAQPMSREKVVEAHRLLAEVLDEHAEPPQAPVRPRKGRGRKPLEPKPEAEPESEPAPASTPEPKQEQEPEPGAEAREDPMARFRVNNTPRHGRRLAGAQPWEPPTTNHFKDDGKIARELVQDSVHASKTQTPTERTRPAYQDIELTCSRCRKTFRVHPGLRPVKLDDDDREYEWKCDRCVGGR